MRNKSENDYLNTEKDPELLFLLCPSGKNIGHSLSLPLFPRHPLELAHLSGVNERSDDGQVIDLRRVGVFLVALEEEL